MRRPARQFCTRLSELEGRCLLSTAPALTHAPNKFWATNIEFVNSNGVVLNQHTQVATQQDGAAIVNLHRTETIASGWNPTPTPYMPFQQVRVTTDPSSPAVGVNVAPVDQIVTFAPGQTDASLSVPILAGAPNPGEVNVELTLTPIDPPPNPFNTASGPLELKIGASEAQIPPSIVAAHLTRQGVVLTFDKPMDPAGASNVNNYRCISNSSGWFGNPQLVKIKAAQYDPATDSVTLVLAGKRPDLAVTNSRRKVGPPLADLEGNLIVEDPSAPGNFYLNYF